jgi:hypothetical protein
MKTVSVSETPVHLNNLRRVPAREVIVECKAFFSYLSISCQPADIIFTKIFPQIDGSVYRKSMEIPSFQPDNIKGHDHKGDVGVDGMTMLKWISNMVQESLIDERDSWEDPLEDSRWYNQGT